MKPVIPLNQNNKWRSYRRYRIAWWLGLAALAACFYFAPFEASAAGLLGFLAYTIFVSYLACPICDYPVGYNGHAKLHFFRPSPFGGWCWSCGERLFLRRRTSA